MRTLKRYASRVVLAFDADAAGQGAAERFYEWEQKYQVEVYVARFPAGKDPGELAVSDPAALRDAVDHALPFLGFRLERLMEARRGANSPEQRSRLANDAMAIVSEHPDRNVRKLYAGQIATRTGLPVADLMNVAERGGGRVVVASAAPKRIREGSEFVALANLVQDWDGIAEWLTEHLFEDELHLRAFRAIAEAGGELAAALEIVDPEARALLERAAVADLEFDPMITVHTLIRQAVRNMLGRRTHVTDMAEAMADRDARLQLELLDESLSDQSPADALLQWLDQRSEERD